MYELKFLSLKHENELILSQMFCDRKSVAVTNYSSEKLKTFWNRKILLVGNLMYTNIFGTQRTGHSPFSLIVS